MIQLSPSPSNHANLNLSPVDQTKIGHIIGPTYRFAARSRWRLVTVAPVQIHVRARHVRRSTCQSENKIKLFNYFNEFKHFNNVFKSTYQTEFILKCKVGASAEILT